MLAPKERAWNGEREDIPRHADPCAGDGEDEVGRVANRRLVGEAGFGAVVAPRVSLREFPSEGGVPSRPMLAVPSCLPPPLVPRSVVVPSVRAHSFHL